VIGPQWGFNVGATLKTTGVPNGNGNSTAILAVKKNDFGIAYGLGVDFAITPSKTIRLDIGFRGVMGLMDVNNTNEKIDANSYYILQKSTINSYSGYVGLTFLF
jgi:opacity protein-like surface antigen